MTDASGRRPGMVRFGEAEVALLKSTLRRPWPMLGLTRL